MKSPRRSAEETHTIVVGGTRGIGRAVVSAFAREGHRVSVIARNHPDPVPEDHPRVRYWTADLLDRRSIEGVLQEIVSWRKPSHLVFSQRFRGAGPNWQGELETTLTATQTVIDLLQGHFDPRKEHSIVIVSSVAGRVVAGEQSVAYHVAKGGIVQLVRYNAVTLGPRGVRVNCVSPGKVVKSDRRSSGEEKSLAELYRRLTPLGRVGTDHDIAASVVFLCGPGATFITGQDIVVDGGLSLLGHESLIRKVHDALKSPTPRRSKRD